MMRLLFYKELSQPHLCSVWLIWGSGVAAKGNPYVSHYSVHFDAKLAQYLATAQPRLDGPALQSSWTDQLDGPALSF